MASGSRPPSRRDGRVRIGVSSCLLGRAVRYDGGHKRHAFLVETLARAVEWVPVCPEVELGLGVPRPTLRLQRQDGAVRLVMPATRTDYTERMRAYAVARTAALAREPLSGFVLKQHSPSCGIDGVEVHGRLGTLRRGGRGLFAAALLARCPDLPVVEEAGLDDAARRDDFVERVFAYHRLQTLFARRWRLEDLARFHRRHELQLRAHAPRAYARLGQLIVRHGTDRRTLTAAYSAQFMRALQRPATRGRHVIILRRIAAPIRRRANAGVRRSLERAIADYAAGRVPLAEPLRLLRRCARGMADIDVAGQTYLAPYPAALRAANAVFRRAAPPSLSSVENIRRP